MPLFIEHPYSAEIIFFHCLLIVKNMFNDVFYFSFILKIYLLFTIDVIHHQTFVSIHCRIYNVLLSRALPYGQRAKSAKQRKTILELFLTTINCIKL